MKKHPNLKASFFLIIVGLVLAQPLTAAETVLHHFGIQMPKEIQLGKEAEIEIHSLDSDGKAARITMDVIAETTNRNGTISHKVRLKNGKGKLALSFSSLNDQGVLILKVSNEEGTIFNTESARVTLPVRGAK